MTDRTNEVEYGRLVTECQRRLYAYILVQVRDPHVADDVLQQTNTVLWEKMDQFTPGTNFNAWACRIAHFQVLAIRKTQGRERQRFSDTLLDKLAATAERRDPVFEDRRRALLGCLGKLSKDDRELVSERYFGDTRIDAIAESTQRSSGAIRQALYRIRGILHACIEQTLGAETEAAR
ncbi:MAG: sigma-70 family RNA polymerase sigma factor [Phycisphaera sp.]|nr:sigma-70 family RNA polymerase sigma factor [Phycisphaera sp.]